MKQEETAQYYDKTISKSVPFTVFNCSYWNGFFLAFPNTRTTSFHSSHRPRFAIAWSVCVSGLTILTSCLCVVYIRPDRAQQKVTRAENYNTWLHVKENETTVSVDLNITDNWPTATCYELSDVCNERVPDEIRRDPDNPVALENKDNLFKYKDQTRPTRKKSNKLTIMRTSIHDEFQARLAPSFWISGKKSFPKYFNE